MSLLNTVMSNSYPLSQTGINFCKAFDVFDSYLALIGFQNVENSGELSGPDSCLGKGQGVTYLALLESHCFEWVEVPQTGGILNTPEIQVSLLWSRSASLCIPF